MYRLAVSSSLFFALGALAACDGGSGDDGSASTMDETGETGGALIPEPGDYLLEISKKTGMCRSEEEMPSWKVTMPLPAGGGAWDLTEEYSGADIMRQDPYPCDLSDDRAICGVNRDRDYTAEMMGFTAVVTAKRSWEFTWSSETEFTGIVSVDLRCVGSSCDDIAGDYLVVEWDCLTEAEFSGSKQ